MRRALRPVSFLVALFACIGVLVFGTLGRAEDKGILADLISKLLSSPGMQVSVGSVEGALTSDATIHDITIADKNGVWFKLDRARLIWTRSALFSRRLEVNTLEIGKIDISRKPLASQTQTPAQSAIGEPLLPELPLKLEIKAFTLAELSLGEPILGAVAKLTSTGKATLGNPSEGLDLDLSLRRLDAPGEIALRLGFVPKTQMLTLQAKADEPEGGLIVRAARLPNLPPLKLDFSGAGPLDNFNSKLLFTAGPDIGADGSVQLLRQGAGRVLGLGLNARIEGLLPPAIAPIFAGPTQLSGSVTLGDDSSVAFHQVALVAKLARVDIGGTIGADQALDLQASVRSVPQADGASRLKEASVGILSAEVAANGTLFQPKLTADFKLASAKLPAGTLGDVSAHLTAVANGLLTNPVAKIALDMEATGKGLALADPSYSRAIGDSFALSVHGALTPDGQGDYSLVHLQNPALNANFTGQFGPKLIAGAADIAAPDLKRFAGLTGLSLEGAATLHADVTNTPAANLVEMCLNGTATKFATGIAPFDGLSGGRVTLQGVVKQGANGSFGFANLQLNGEHFTALLDGDANQKTSNILGRITLPSLKFADSRLTGTGNLEAHLTGALAHPDLTASLNIANASALGRPIPQLVLATTIQDLTGAAQGKLTLDGQVDRRPARGGFSFAKLPEGGWRLAETDLSIGSVSLKGAADLDAQSLANGHLVLSATNLDDLSALALQKLGGKLNADLTLDSAGGAQGVTIIAKGSGISSTVAKAATLEANLRIADLYRRPTLDGTAAFDQVTAGAETIPKLRLTAKANQGTSDIMLAASARGFDVQGRGRLITGEDKLRFDLASFTTRQGATNIALAAPTSLTLLEKGVALKNLVLNANGGRVSLDGTLGANLDANIVAKALPLALVDLVAPNTGLSGTLDAEARLTGSPAQPTGDWRAHISNLVAPQTRQNGLPPIDIAANGRLNGNTTSVEGKVNAGSAGALTFKGQAPLIAGGTFNLTTKGRLDIGFVNATLSVNGQHISGAAVVDATLTGTAAAPNASGSIVLSGGTFADPARGVAFSNIEARLTARGDHLDIEQASATTKNGGKIAVNGQIQLAPNAGFPGKITLTSQRAQLISSDLMTAVADLNLQISGPLAQKPEISGLVKLNSLEVAIPDRLAGDVAPLANATHIKPTGSAATRLNLQRKADAKSKGQLPFDAHLNVTVSAPSRIFIRGRGIDAELGGDLKLTGLLSNMSAIGGFELRRGLLNLLGQRLEFTQGKLTFAGDLVPELDFTAETKTSDITAMVLITGPATQPIFTLSSSPELPRDEILSHILFEKASGGLSPLQALQLANGLAQLSGIGGVDVFEKTRKALGVDSLDVQAGANGPKVGASRYITKNISIGVTTGAKPEDSGVSVKVDIGRHLKVEGGAGADGRTSVGVGAEWEY